MRVLGGVFVLKSGLRILIRAPQVLFLVPPKTPILGVFGFLNFYTLVFWTPLMQSQCPPETQRKVKLARKSSSNPKREEEDVKKADRVDQQQRVEGGLLVQMAVPDICIVHTALCILPPGEGGIRQSCSS